LTEQSAEPLQTEQPTLAEFLAAPIESVRRVAPETMILGTGGTRRHAILAGFSAVSDEYAKTTRREMMACYELIFAHGVQHLLATMLVSSHFQETTPGYRENLLGWLTWAMVGSEARAAYARLGWRVRLIGAESWPEILPIAEQLVKLTADHPGPTLWYTIGSQTDVTWSHMLQHAIAGQITDRRELIRALYGEDIPPATLYLGAGKPQVEDSQIPLLLIGKLESYWRQHLGYNLDVQTLRTIFHDYAYLRRTWRADKTGRAEAVKAYAQAWENPPVIGLGRRLGPFWYPAPIAAVAPEVGKDG
jgi:hypothetical protein